MLCNIILQAKLWITKAVWRYYFRGS